MARLYLAALLALGAASVQAQPPVPAMPIQPSVDSAEQRQALRNLAICLAELRPRWARSTLSQPYRSDAQERTASEALRGTDSCISRNGAEVTFRTSSVVASLAEHYLRAEIGQLDFARLTAALSTMTPLNASEDFGLCVASGNPAAARDLALSELGSPAEIEAARQLAANLSPCINQGERLTVDLQSLRALTSLALYRGTMTVTAAGN